MNKIIELIKQENVESIVNYIDSFPDSVNSTDTTKRNLSALHHAAQLDLDKVVFYLLVAGANPNKQDSDGNTPLHFAAGRGNVQIAKMLIECNSDPTISNNSGYNAFHSALNSRNSELINIMREVVFGNKRD